MSPPPTQARLQGGPFDGFPLVINVTPPMRLYATPCKECRAHISSERTPKSEVYRRDDLHKGVLLYVFCDKALAGPDGRGLAAVKQREHAAASS